MNTIYFFENIGQKLFVNKQRYHVIHDKFPLNQKGIRQIAGVMPNKNAPAVYQTIETSLQNYPNVIGKLK